MLNRLYKFTCLLTYFTYLLTYYRQMVDGYDQVHESNEERRNNYSCPYLLSDWVFNANDTDAGQITDHLILHVPVGL